jgi:hypothetical protein
MAQTARLDLPVVQTVLDECIRYLDPEFLQAVSIFRHQGDEDAVQQCLTEIMKGNTACVASLSDHNVVATVLKRVVALLSAPIFSDSVYEQMKATHAITNKKERTERTIPLIGSLPAATSNLLSRLFTLLHGVASLSEQNKMNSYLLGVIFAQALFPRKTVEETLADQKSVPFV